MGAAASTGLSAETRDALKELPDAAQKELAAIADKLAAKGDVTRLVTSLLAASNSPCALPVLAHDRRLSSGARGLSLRWGTSRSSASGRVTSAMLRAQRRQSISVIECGDGPRKCEYLVLLKVRAQNVI